MYPLYRRDDRQLPHDFSGVIVTCDIDKTYLDTRFSSLRKIASIPLEWAEDKQAIAGMISVLKQLRYGTGEFNAQVPLYFITASPPILVNILFRKMLLDGVQADGITCKDWQAVLLKRRKPSWLKRQVAYKVCALLHQRLVFPTPAHEILIGDDTESDADAYCIYADIIGGHINRQELIGLLEAEGCDDEEIEEVVEAAGRLNMPKGSVRKIYIQLVEQTNPARYLKYSDGLVTCRSPFQFAVSLVLEGMVKPKAAADAARELLARSGMHPDVLARELADGVERGNFSPSKLRPLHRQLHELGLVTAPRKYPARNPELTHKSRTKSGGRLITYTK
jgi:Phosphatidate phosphatase APP1, catalytic domain